MITREADGTIYTHAGPEIGVASTKAFTGQLTALYSFALYLGAGARRHDAEEAKAAVQELMHIPGKMEQILTHDEACEELAQTYVRAQDFLFLGRGIHYPIALEGALKLKEISYIHAEGYPAGEMKHGPNALIDENLPVVIIATRDVNEPPVDGSLRKNDVKPEGSKGSFRHRDRTRNRRRQGNRRGSRSRALRSASPRRIVGILRLSLCNCSPITSPSAAAATWISREIWPKSVTVE